MILNKPQMYALLDSGALGNTVTRYSSLSLWEERTEDHPLWGLRNATSAGGDKRHRLDIPTEELPGLYRQWYGQWGGEISPMVDHMLTARFQLIEDPTLRLQVVIGRPDVKWRDAFRQLAVNYTGLCAWQLLKRYLNPTSMDDLYSVLERYPGHAVELTTLRMNYGTLPNRNTIVWEVRHY